MQRKRMSIDFDLKFQEIIDINSSFALGKIAVCYTGRNRNKSDISKDILTKSLESLKNCPVVGRYDAEKDDFGGHDVRVVRDKETDEWIIENATVPFGVVPESSKMEFSEVTEKDGSVHEYLFVTVILWKRQPGFKCIVENKKLGHSMEIIVNSYIIDNDGYCIIEDMEFEALCILGSDVEPCFESSSIEIIDNYAINNFKSQFSTMLNELKDIAATYKNVNDNTNTSKGGNNLDRFNDILQELGLTPDKITFEITDDMTEEIFRENITTMLAASNSTDSENAKTSEFDLKYATYNQTREAIINVLDPVIVRNGAGDRISATYYWLMDFDDKYAFVERYQYTEADEKTDHGRFEYTFNKEDSRAVITGDFELMIITWLTVEENNKLEQSRNAFTSLQTDYNKYKTEHSATNDEVSELKNFKESKLKIEHEQLIDDLLNEFEDLNDIPEFIELKEKAYEYQTDDLKNACYIIRGKNAYIKQDAKSGKSTYTKLPIVQQDDAEPYGGIFNVYKNKKI